MPTRKVPPHHTLAVATYCKSCTHQKATLLRLLEDARRARRQIDLLITEVDTVVRTMIFTQSVLTEALAQSHLVDVKKDA